ncbi:hypothetical protein [Micromonospora sp. NPDC004551]|uniref:hypothetical protein n=1 Tax=Micromonospora sp. NPDC004551 TaxID=3154284 RepID=UPI00339EB6A7
MTIEAWIGLASLVATVAGVVAAIRFRPKELPAAAEHQEERREAIAALNDMEKAINAILVGRPIVRGAAELTMLTESLQRLDSVGKAAPAIGRVIESLRIQGHLVEAASKGIPDDKEIGYALREWRRTDDPTVFEPGPLLRRIAGTALAQFHAAKDCKEKLTATREALTG